MNKDWHPNQVPEEVKYAESVVAENLSKGNTLLMEFNLKKKEEGKKSSSRAFLPN